MSTIPDPTTTEWVPIWNPNAGQTPWISNIDGGGFNLTNAEYLFAQDVICGYKDFNSTGPATLMGPGTFTWYGPAGNFSSRWNMVLNGAESGANAGSNFWIYRYNDDGSPIGPAITINRATGVMDFVVQPTVNGGPITVPQTPWVSDIDAGNFRLLNVKAIGVGLTPAYKLDVAGDVNATGAYRQNAVAFYSGGNLIVAANATIAAGLSVGKTTAPNFAVDVVGDVNCSGAFRINGVVHAGRAGIAPPLAPLHVSGQAQLPGWSAIFDDPSSPEWLLIGASSGVPAIQGSDPDGNTSPITLNPLGNNVGVNTAVPAYPLDVVGDVNCTGKVRVNGVPLAPFVTVISYRGDTSTTQMSDPGTGLMRWSAPAAADTTELAFDRLTTDNNIDATLMWVVANPVRLLIQDAELALNFQYWTITGPLISQADWFRIPVRFESGGGTGADMFAPKPKPIRLIVYLLNY